MKKIYAITSIYLSILLVSLILQGCCTEIYRIVGNGEFNAYDAPYDQNVKIDTIRREFVLVAQFESKRIGFNLNSGLMSTAYAFSCGENYTNRLEGSTLKLSCNKAFSFDNEVIPANSNLIDLAKINTEILNDIGIVQINFTSEFMADAVFENGIHVFQIEVETCDDIELNNEVEVVMEL